MILFGVKFLTLHFSSFRRKDRVVILQQILPVAGTQHQPRIRA
jgi:hypothetical protein